MKAGMTLEQMAAEINRRQQTKRDYAIHGQAIRPVVAFGEPTVALGNLTNAMPLTGHAHGQVAQHYGIPRAYYDRMCQDAPELWRDSIAAWRDQQPNDKRLVRTLDERVRAFLSPRYRRVDDLDVAEAVLPVMMEAGPDLRVESTALTETRLYLKAFWPTVQAEVRKGDVVQAGIMVRNSEVGAGALEVAPYLLRLLCLNGMKVPEYGQRRNHVGRLIDVPEDDAAAELYSDDTKRKDDAALLGKIVDTVRAVADEARFMALAKRLREAAEQRIEVNPEDAVRRLADRSNLTEVTRGSVLRHLIDGGDLSAWGLANAVTATANDADDYEQATDLERLGGEVIALDRDQWRVLAQAA